MGLHTDLGNALFKTGRMADAAAEYEIVLRATPDSVGIHFQLGLALGLSGRIAEAKAHFETVLRLQPGHVGASRALAALQDRP